MSDDTETPREPWNADGGTAMTNAAAVIASAASEQATASPTAEGEGGSDAPASATGSAPEGQSTGKAGEPMQGSSTESETIVVHSDSTIEYGCPGNGSWDHSVVLQGSLTGSTANGPGCYARFTFTGDSVTMYGATGPKAGVFGCSTASDIWEAVGWWNGYGTSPLFAAYQGSCTIAGLGFGTHTITITNNPNDPKLLYFTGLRYGTNQSAVTYAAPEWSACCGPYSFPEGATTTIAEGSGKGDSSGTASGSAASSTGSKAASTTSDLDTKTMISVALVGLGLVALASLLIGCMCCRKRSKPSDDALSVLARGGDEKEPLRRRKKKRSSKRRAVTPPSTDEDTQKTESETGSSGESEDEKGRGRKR